MDNREKYDSLALKKFCKGKNMVMKFISPYISE